MATDYPGIGKTTFGRDFNYYKRVTVSSASFEHNDGYSPDAICTIANQGFILAIETTTSPGVIAYSFNGTTEHGRLIPSTDRAVIKFENRVVSKIWFRLVSGGTTDVSIEAWSVR